MWALFGRDFGYDLAQELPTDENFSFWRVYKGKKKGTNENVSVFYWTVTAQPKMSANMEIGKSAIKRLKTLRHPCLLTYLHSYEGYQSLYLATESVVPLSETLTKNKYTPSQKKYAISYGLHQILSALNFLHTDCGVSHNNVNRFSIFVNKAGEWKLFGLEYSTVGDEQPPAKDVLMQPVYLYDPPEADHPTRKRNKWSYDTWGFGCLIWEIYNGSMAKSIDKRPNGQIPKALLPAYLQCYNKNATERPSPGQLLEQLTKPKQFLNNVFIDTMLYLREIHIKDNEEKINFFNSLPDLLDSFPQDACLYRILPELINAFEFGNAGSSVLPSVFKLGKKLKEDEYQEMVVPCIVKMFLSKDRNMRIKLLEKMGEFIDNFSPAIVNTQIYPNVVQGFLDTSPTIREHTIKCMIPLAPKLNSQNLNDDLLKHFARLQMKDEQGGIRTNTTVCLGKIASYLQPETRQKILINAFVRALRDPFPPARTAAVLAFSATEHYYSVKDIASKVLPALCFVTIDPDKGVRDQVFKSIDGFLQKLSKLSEEPSLLQELEKDLQSTTPSAAASSWTSWAVSSLVDKLTSSKSSSNVTKATTSENPEETKLITPKVEIKKTPTSPIHKKEDTVKPAVSQKSKIDSQIVIISKAESPLETVPTENLDWGDDGWEEFGDLDLLPREDNSPKTDSVYSTASVKETKTELISNVSQNNSLDGWGHEDGDWGSWDDTEFDNTAKAKKPQLLRKQTDRKKD